MYFGGVHKIRMTIFFIKLDLEMRELQVSVTLTAARFRFNGVKMGLIT